MDVNTLMLVYVHTRIFIQESLFILPVVCARMESRLDLHESVNFEVQNGFCPGLEISHAHVIPLLDRHCWSNVPQIPHSSLTSVPAEEVWGKGLCHCFNLGWSDVHLLSCLYNLGLGHLWHVFKPHFLRKASLTIKIKLLLCCYHLVFCRPFSVRLNNESLAFIYHEAPQDLNSKTFSCKREN